jgi:hypothetical protein
MTVDPRFVPAPEWTAARGHSGWPEHPNGTTVLVLGILSISLLVTGPFAWYLGAKAKKEIAASGQHYANERDLEIGRLIGMITTIVGGVFALLMIGFWVFFAIFFASVLGSFPR